MFATSIMMKIGHMTSGPTWMRPVSSKNRRWNHGSTNIIGTTANSRFTYSQPSVQ